MDDVFYSTDAGGLVGLVALDLRKAFDTLSHYGITDTNRSWFKSYLSDWTQVASINGSLSTSMTIETGVPQGSILVNMYMYADDTAFYTPATTYVK